MGSRGGQPQPCGVCGRRETSDTLTPPPLVERGIARKTAGSVLRISAQDKQSDVRAGIPLTWHGGLWIQSERRIHTRNRKSAYEGVRK